MTDDEVPALVDTDWLAARLEDPDLRVLDCTMHLTFDPETGARQSESGYDDWLDAHVPGSVHADLLTDLSETDDPDYPLQLPPAEAFAAAMERLGVGDDARVVCYDADGNEWAARVWWMLRAFGFDRAGVLDGGWTAWTAEGRPTESGPVDPEPATFTPDPRPDLFVDREEVRARLGDGDTCLLNALRPEDHDGTGLVKYGRPGHIPGSVNVPAVGEEGIVDEATDTYLPREELRRRFAAAGALDADRTITYCGGGIAASSAAFALHLLGVDDVAIYDGSLSEWGREPELPMETETGTGE